MSPPTDASDLKPPGVDGGGVTVKPDGIKTVLWAAAFLPWFLVLCASYLAYVQLPVPSAQPIRRDEPKAVVIALAVLAWYLYVFIRAGRVTVTADENGLTRLGVVHRGKHWSWSVFSRAEVRRTGFGRTVMLYKPGSRFRVRPGPRYATAASVDRLAAVVGAHIPLTDPSPKDRWRPPEPATAIAIALVFVVLYVWLPSSGKVREAPGTVLQMNHRVTAPAAVLHSRPGVIFSLSISVDVSTPYQRWFSDRGDHSVQVISPRIAAGRETAHQSAVEVDLDNRVSKAAAKYVALNRLGYHVTASGGQAIVRYAPPGSPLHRGDRIDAVGDTQTPYEQDLYATLEGLYTASQGQVVGRQVDVTVTSNGRRAHRLVTVRKPGEIETLPSLAGAAYTAAPIDVSTPFDITVDTDNEGGPSAGLAMTLGLLDSLSPTPIMGPVRVAVTGTIGPDGKVGPIGGLRQKVALARDNGATLLIVPQDEELTARRFAGPLHVVGVANLDQALAALAATIQ